MQDQQEVHAADPIEETEVPAQPDTKNDDPPQPAPSVEELLQLIKTLSQKKSDLTQTISKLKKQVQRMVGEL